MSISCTSLTFREKSETSLLKMVTVRIRVIFLCQVFLCGFVELACTPGFDSELFVFKVRSDHLDRETKVGEVIFNACDVRSRSVFQSGDKRFSVRTDGSVRLKTPVTLHDGYMMFDVHAWDSRDMKHTASVRVECTAHHHEDHHMNTAVNITPQMDTLPDDLVVRFPRFSAGLKRSKRDWVIPPLRVYENKDLTKGIFGQIKSDLDRVKYSLSGEGADQAPFNLFVINQETGDLRVTNIFDREIRASYKLFPLAYGEGGVKEKPMEIIIEVIDVNDNKPRFTQNTFNGNVPDAAPKNYEFMTVTATDADDPNTDNAEVRYKIISQDPPSPNPNMFDINPVTGVIRVIGSGLDRKKWSKYTLVLEAANMNVEGYTTTSTAVITVTDSNDNPPQFEQDTYTVSVPENQVGVEVAKLTVTDGDELGSPAWSTKYKIISGDRLGVFNISTGPSQLEGIITTVKPLEYEKTKQYILSVIVENDHPFVGSLPTSTATVTVNVEDVNEPPVFNPKEKHIIKPEDVPVGSDLVAFTATDPDTERSQKLTYRIGSDPAGFLSVVEDTGMIKVKSLMDRESNEVKDSKYKAILLAVDDDAEARATGTGTLIIELEDVNDNAPYINEREIKICNQEAPPVLLSITDKYLHPNAGPFSVETQGDTRKYWTARMNNSGTGIELILNTMLMPGVYNVILRVFDKQKLNQDNSLKATVCNCKGESVVCSETRVAGLSLSGVVRIICTIFALLSISYLLVLFMRQQICLGQGGV
ncbi:cadherin-1 [Misgurnus anguillicaudatus]|uniref:cadherin-1 n=1 Tax=Misgurnus anguillicaudatus TaxID=75329 RepID=UPI003CCF9ECE